MASLEHFLSFAAAARHASFAGAARELGLSPSAVAKNVGRLEARFRVRLFHRTTRQVTLTQDGEALYERCRRILDEVEALESAAEGTRGVPRGTLRIDVPLAYGKRVVLPVLARLAARHPDLHVDARFSDRFADLVKEGLDAAVRVGTLADSRLVARTFDRQWLWVCASPTYLERHGTPRSPEDLASHTCMAFRLPTSGRSRPWQFRVRRRDVEVHPDARIRLDDGEALVQAAAEGLGLVQVPHYMAEQEIERGRLVEVLKSVRPAAMPISVVYPSQRHVPLRVRVLVDALVASRRAEATA